MTFADLLQSSHTVGEYAESNGYYERVPIRVGEFVLVKNEEGEVIFETSSQEFCDGGPKVVYKIVKSDEDNNWSVNAQQGKYHWTITPSVDLAKEKLARRRAFWHAGQSMAGRELSHEERFSIIHQGYADNPDVFESDAYFKDGNPVTNDPFGEFLQR